MWQQNASARATPPLSGWGGCETDARLRRKLLLAADGSTLPVGVWVNGWEAGEATAKIVKVLAEETPQEFTRFTAYIQ